VDEIALLALLGVGAWLFLRSNDASATYAYADGAYGPVPGASPSGASGVPWAQPGAILASDDSDAAVAWDSSGYVPAQYDDNAAPWIATAAEDDPFGENAQAEAMLGATWDYPTAAKPYIGAIEAASAANGLPDLLLGRLLYQESRYRPDIISGATVSSAGALGIAQFMPSTAADLGIDPLNPQQAIYGAARYLRTLYNQTGSWSNALAAYNWGVGNVLRKGFAAAPLETRNYVAQITADVGIA
jgi:soluble lytic murein transglycosylase-like protein